MTTAAPAEGARPEEQAPPRLGRRAFVAAALALLAALAFIALGIWQIERRAWKLALIARVEARVAAPAAPLPARADWAGVNRDADEYRRVRVRGRFLAARSVRVLALTELGSGFWVLTPLETESGDAVLVDRGFVLSGWIDPDRNGPSGAVTVTGLLRMTEPGGGILRPNDPSADLWYSRDVAAIARARGLGTVAPFFVDEDASANAPGQPVGGLTVVSFRNDHLVYALTWFALAAMSIGAAWRILSHRAG